MTDSRETDSEQGVGSTDSTGTHINPELIERMTSAVRKGGEPPTSVAEQSTEQPVETTDVVLTGQVPVEQRVQGKLAQPAHLTSETAERLRNQSRDLRDAAINRSQSRRQHGQQDSDQ